MTKRKRATPTYAYPTYAWGLVAKRSGIIWKQTFGSKEEAISNNWYGERIARVRITEVK